MFIHVVPTFHKTKCRPKQVQYSCLWAVTAKSLATEALTTNLCITLTRLHAKDLQKGTRCYTAWGTIKCLPLTSNELQYPVGNHLCFQPVCLYQRHHLMGKQTELLFQQLTCSLATLSSHRRCQKIVTQSLLYNRHTAPAIQLERIHSCVHRIQLWNLLKNPGGPNVLPTTLLHAKDSSWLLQVTGRHFFNLQVSFYGPSWLAADDFLTHAYVAVIPFLHSLCLKSQSTKTASMRDNLSDLSLCKWDLLPYFLTFTSFINVLKCIFYSESCKEMLLFLFYPSLDWVKDDFKIIGYITALLSQEHNKSVN